jgi:hypothetical protein
MNAPTSKGTLIFGSAVTGLVLAVWVTVFQLGDRFEARADTSPAKIRIEWPNVTLEAQTGPGEHRPAFNADVISMYREWNKELR